MGDIGSSIVRTVVPLVVGVVVAWLARHNVDGSAYADFLSAVVAAVVTTVYYAVVRVLETYVKPRFGWLLGLAKPPTYGVTAGRHAAD